MNQVSKHQFLGLNTDLEHRFLQKGDYLFLENGRVGSSQEDSLGAVENIKGNVKVAHTLPAGTNKCIGSKENPGSGDIVYFVHNSNDDHSILRYDGTSITTVCSGPVLAFPDNPITGVAIVDTYLVWTDNTNPIRFISLNNNDVAITAEQISLYPIPPIQKPLAVRKTDFNRTTNLVANRNFQFAYRYIYPDGGKSVFSPLSTLSIGEKTPNLFTVSNNYIELFVAPETNVSGLIDYIEVAYRENNTGTYYIYERIKSTGAAFYYSNFYNSGVVEAVSDAEASKLVENIPVRSKSLEFIKNRLFVSKDVDGYNVDESDFSLSVSVVNQPRAEGELYVKEGGTYDVGIIFFDELSRPTTVMAVETITIPKSAVNESNSYFEVNSFGPRIKVDLAGTPPVHAVRYQIVVSENNFQSAYAQIPVNPLFYAFDVFDGFSESSTFTQIDDKVFYRRKPTNSDLFGDHPPQNIYLQLPTNIPLVPGNDYYVRFPTFESLGVRSYPVLDVIGDMLVIPLIDSHPPFVKIDFTSLPGQWFIEIFSVSESRNSLLYEVGESGVVSNPGQAGRAFGNSSFTFGVDTHYVSVDLDSDVSWVFNNLLDDYTKPSSSQINYDKIDYDLMKKAGGLIESPSGLFDKVTSSADPETEKIGVGRAEIPTNITNSTGWVLDYTKIAGNFGRPNTRDDGYQEEILNDTISFSNPYIQNSRTNGIRTFDTLDEYTLPITRGGIQALRRVGDVLAAVHPRETTTMYIGEGFIRENEGAILAKTTNVIGDDRELVGNYGTKHPESLAIYRGQGFYWDSSQGSVIRYTKEGLYAISNNGMMNYFKGKIGLSAVGGIDPFHGEYIITFSDGETWAFNIKSERWIYKASFVPEYYGYANRSFFSMKDGELWEHNINGTYNNFYGVQYERTLKFAVAGESPSEVKTWQAIRIEAESLYEENDQTHIVAKFTNSNGQETHLIVGNIQHKENIISGDIYNDRNTPNFSNQDEAQFFGDKMRGQVLTVELVNNRSDLSPLYFVNILHKTSPPIYQ